MSLPAYSVLPTSIAEVDPVWMTEVLRADGTLGPADSVTGIESRRIALDTGFSSELWRVELTGVGPLPASVIVKLPTGTVVREAMDLIGGYAREVEFYRDVAARAPMRTPTVHLARMSEDSTDFVLVLEDLGDWQTGDHLTGLPIDRARACLRQLASLHAWSATTDTRLDGFPSLDNPVTRQAFPMLFAQGWQVYRAQAREPVPAAVEAFAASFGDHIGALLEGVTERDFLIHGDIRADNLFFRGEDLAVVDFQLTSRGSGLVDVGYLVSQGLTTTERAGRDRELVAEYLALLQADGTVDYPFDEAWRHYRAAVALFLVFPVIAIRGWDLLPDKARELCLRLVERSIATIVDIDAIGVLA